ncbi:MAG: MCE family protein [Candidatus Gastranaerophilales bacterium]|nr:MCE family protein [Candidatus Gastranaerophilales bacterium]
MNKKKKYSSALKVGILTLSAISILIFTVLWVKGRSLSAGERIDLAFKDVNGMRAGSAVQMMGLRIGQVEDITPVIQGKDSYVKLRFVITEKGVKIPYASTISIQQSGIIGEQFLEVTPPKNEFMFAETSKNTTIVEKDQAIYMELSEGMVQIGKAVEAEVVKKSQIPFELRQKMSTNNVLKLVYNIELPGLILDKNSLGMKIKEGKIIFYLLDGEILQTPKKDLKYTVIEPMRLTDFMDLGFRATHAMLETNDKITEILSDEFIGGIKTSVQNISLLTQSANTTLDKAALLIDSSKAELEELANQSQDLIKSLNTLSCNLNELISDETLKNDVVSSLKSVGKMSENINRILEDEQTEQIMADINETSRNLADISSYVNEYTKDEKLKEDITTTITNLSSITTNIAKVMDDYNKLDDGEKLKLKSTVKDVSVITKNVRKFSEKLNKRFLLFRLMF